MRASDETMPREACVEDVRRMARRTALLYHYFVTTLVDELGEEQAQTLTSEAIRRYGEHIGDAVRQRVREMGLSNAPDNFGKVADLPSVGWETAEVETEHGPRSRITYCPLAATWQELGSEDWGRLYCYVDQAKYRAFNPCAVLVHTKNVLDGDPHCEFDLQLEDDSDTD